MTPLDDGVSMTDNLFINGKLLFPVAAVADFTLETFTFVHDDDGDDVDDDDDACDERCDTDSGSVTVSLDTVVVSLPFMSIDSIDNGVGVSGK